jgi:hypothetical protein
LTTLRSDISSDVERVIMSGLAREVADRPATAVEWFEQLDSAIGTQTTQRPEAESRLVILAPSGAEVYIDDERQASVGRSGRVILTAIAPGRHVLRVARSGEKDDERVIEIRPDSAEQIIQAQLKIDPSSNAQLTPSHGGSLDSHPEATSVCREWSSALAAIAFAVGASGSAAIATTRRATAHMEALPEMLGCPESAAEQQGRVPSRRAALRWARSSVANAAFRLASRRLTGRHRCRWSFSGKTCGSS